MVIKQAAFKRGVKNFSIGRLIIYVFLIALSITTLIPFFWMLSSSLKYDVEVFAYPFKWIPNPPRWSNFVEVWTRVPFAKFYLNTIKLAVVITILQMITSSMAAFSFTKLRFPGRDTMFLGYLATMMVPMQVIMIPQFIIMKRLGLTNSHMPIILLQAFTPFGVFLLKQFMAGIPNEMLEAAKIDGANNLQIFIYLMVPLAATALSALGIITFIGAWNDFMTPMIYIDSVELRTITIGIRTFSNEYGAEFGIIMAGTVSALAPMILIYAIGQKQIINGIAFNGGAGIKG